MCKQLLIPCSYCFICSSGNLILNALSSRLYCLHGFNSKSWLPHDYLAIQEHSYSMTLFSKNKNGLAMGLPGLSQDISVGFPKNVKHGNDKHIPNNYFHFERNVGHPYAMMSSEQIVLNCMYHSVWSRQSKFRTS